MNETVTLNKPCLLSRHHDLTRFASTEESRWVLNGVFLDTEGRHAYATNTEIAVRIPLTESIEEFPPVADKSEVSLSGNVPAKTLTKALSNIPAKSNLPVLACLKMSCAANGDATPKVTLTATDLEQENAVTSKCIEGQFPLPALREFFAPKEAKFTVTLKASLLAALASYADKFGMESKKDQGDVAIKFEFTDELSAVKASFNINAPIQGIVKAEAILMPMQISPAAPSGA